MVDLAFNRYFDPRFIQFGLTALILKLVVYFIQSHINPNMSYLGPDAVVIKKGNSSATVHLFGMSFSFININSNSTLWSIRECVRVLNEISSCLYKE